MQLFGTGQMTSAVAITSVLRFVLPSSTHSQALRVFGLTKGEAKGSAEQPTREAVKMRDAVQTLRELENDFHIS